MSSWKSIYVYGVGGGPRGIPFDVTRVCDIFLIKGLVIYNDLRV